MTAVQVVMQIKLVDMTAEQAQLKVFLPIPQYFPRRVMPRNSRYTTTRMGPGPALIQPLDGSAIVAVSQHRSRAEQLIERQRAVKYIAADQAKFPLQIEWRMNLPRDHAGAEIGREFAHRRDHQIGHFFTMVIPTSAFAQSRCHVLAKQTRDVFTNRRQ